MQSITLLLAILPLAPLPTPDPAPTRALTFQDDSKKEYETRRSEADGDATKLWALVDWCEANSLEKEKRSCLRALLKIDDGDRKAHELLGHLFYDDQWFTSQKKLDAHKKKEDERMAKEKGLVRFKGEWVKEEDIPFLKKGLSKSADGKWVDAAAIKRLEEGWVQQDLTWISPDEFEKMEAGLWKCGEDWLSLEDANNYHSEVMRWWVIPGDYFTLYSTLPREVAERAMGEAERTFRDLVRAYGQSSTDPLGVAVLNSGEQYNRFAGGDDSWPGTDALGLSSIHGAFFADAMMDFEERKWMGMGTAYWDYKSDAGNSFGPNFTRHAAGQSFGEFIDPSPKAIKKFERSEQAQFSVDDFYGEKKIPAWFRYGVSSYVERYFIDAFVGADGNPYWAREWSVSNIARAGGLDPLSTVFEMAVGVDNPDSGKLLNESGLLVAFMLDGDSPELKQAHAATKAAMKSGKGLDKAFMNLEKALEQDIDKLRMFADL